MQKIIQRYWGNKPNKSSWYLEGWVPQSRNVKLVSVIASTFLLGQGESASSKNYSVAAIKWTYLSRNKAFQASLLWKNHLAPEKQRLTQDLVQSTMIDSMSNDTDSYKWLTFCIAILFPSASLFIHPPLPTGLQVSYSGYFHRSEFSWRL